MTIPTKKQQQAFESFWLIVWRKKGKLDAERKFIQALKRESAEYITEAAKAYADSVRGRDKQYLPHPATWLHQGRYYDELEEDGPNGFDPLKALKELDDNVSH